MMKKIMMFAVLAEMTTLAAAEQPYPSGFSQGPVDVSELPELWEAQTVMKEQTETGQPEEGELPAGLFVETQIRISESFRRPVPDTLLNETRGE